MSIINDIIHSIFAFPEVAGKMLSLIVNIFCHFVTPHSPSCLFISHFPVKDVKERMLRIRKYGMCCDSSWWLDIHLIPHSLGCQILIFLLSVERLPQQRVVMAFAYLWSRETIHLFHRLLLYFSSILAGFPAQNDILLSYWEFMQ